MKFNQTLPLLLITALALGGCVTLRDLSREGGANLGVKDRNAAIQASLLTIQRCAKIVTIGSNKTSESRAISARRAVITRLFRGEDGWYRAESRFEGVTDYVYYNDRDLSFVCGEIQWRKTREFRKIYFENVESPA